MAPFNKKTLPYDRSDFCTYDPQLEVSDKPLIDTFLSSSATVMDVRGGECELVSLVCLVVQEPYDANYTCTKSKTPRIMFDLITVLPNKIEPFGVFNHAGRVF